MKYEKPQKGNVNEITVNQHVFPKKSIERFCNSEGRVQLKLVKENKLLSPKPSNKIFCARRAWDQIAESGYMKSIEDNFQKIVEAIIYDPVNITFNKIDSLNINYFYSLWVFRHHYSFNPEMNIYTDLPSSHKGWSQDQRENLEKVGIQTMNNDGSFPGRHLTSDIIRSHIYDYCEDITDARWGVLRSRNVEFIVPDRPFDFLAVPITPKLMLYSKSDNVISEEAKVKFINNISIKSSMRYYFGSHIISAL